MKPNLLFLFPLIVFAGCAIAVKHELDSVYGPAEVRDRVVRHSTGPDYFSQVKPILDKRCVVCHACYDAPCQLKLSAYEGIDRGATKKEVYDAGRILASEPTRLFIDAVSTEAWREKNFYPVLNEREQTKTANLEGSTLYKMLELKRNNVHLETKILGSSYDFSLDRTQQCPSIEEFPYFTKSFPMWGMPYGLPNLSESEFAVLKDWIANGAKVKIKSESRYSKEVLRWEKFFNGESNKEKLMSRYIYEHLFLASLYFKDIDKFYKLVRSKTPSGEPIEIIPTVRPYDSPGSDKFYYRLWPEHSTITTKTHMPYPLSDTKMDRWKELFLNPIFEVPSLPSYDIRDASNPFKVFSLIPAHSRYKFMLDEAEFTIMNFIKGPVCRGRTALNVIEDRFWVMFVNPDLPQLKDEDDFLEEQSGNLRLPAEESSNAFITSTWSKYSSLQRDYLKAKGERLKKIYQVDPATGLDLIWTGEGYNENAALTIFRHNDAATVVKGFIGDDPKTLWLIGYPLLERIHYHLVAGYDVFGNLGHQLNSRLYMDFLRMEGEYNFLSLLPPQAREKERDFWYRDASSRTLDYLTWGDKNLPLAPGYKFKTDNPKKELLQIVRKNLAPVMSKSYNIEQAKDYIAQQLRKINSGKGEWVRYMPQVAFLKVVDGSSNEAYTLLQDSGYSNVATPLFEDDRRLPEEDELTVVKGLLGAYPNAFYEVKKSELSSFLTTIQGIKSEADYYKMIDKFGIRRSDRRFWDFSDWAHEYFKKSRPIEFGYYDYNRIENR